MNIKLLFATNALVLGVATSCIQAPIDEATTQDGTQTQPNSQITDTQITDTQTTDTQTTDTQSQTQTPSETQTMTTVEVTQTQTESETSTQTQSNTSSQTETETQGNTQTDPQTPADSYAYCLDDLQNNQRYQIQSVANGFVWDVLSVSELAGADIIVWDNLDAQNQQFLATEISAGLWQFTAAHSSLLLAVEDNDTQINGVLEQADQTLGFYVQRDNASQPWRVVPAHSGLTLTLETNEKLSAITQQNEAQSASQRFVFNPVNQACQTGANEFTEQQLVINSPVGSLVAVPPEPEVTLIIEEYGAGWCDVLGEVQSNWEGFNGQGFSNTVNEVNSYISMKIDVAKDTTANIAIRYANSSTDTRPGQFYINGQASTQVEFAQTESWTDWQIVNVLVPLFAGENNIQLKSTGAGGLANIDNMTFTKGNFETLSCLVEDGAKQLEYLTRGVHAHITKGGDVMVSWRLLGTESFNTAFNFYRDGTKLNSTPITEGTNWIDSNGTVNSVYSVAVVSNGVESDLQYQEDSVWSNYFKGIDINQPAPGADFEYAANDASIADVDGDGEYEIILKWDPTNAKDNSQSGVTGHVFIDAYEMDGTQLWRIDLGKNIRAGAHYTQFTVYDFDGDGKAEMGVKTADGTIDGLGNVIGDANADYRETNGYILSGPEFYTIFNGESGAAMATVDFIPPRGTVSSWGDNYGNRVDRFLSGMAFVDGARPSIIVARGYYTRTVITAFDWRNGQLTARWTFDTNDTGLDAYQHQGAHSLSIADVDQDGKDEIIYGAMTVDDDGSPMYNTDLKHGDALHVSDIDPDRPGLEVFMIHENQDIYAELHDAKTGEIIWKMEEAGADSGRGVAANIDPNLPGMETWNSKGGLMTSKGVDAGNKPSSTNFLVYWDGDLLRELLDGTKLDKWNYNTSAQERMLTIYQDIDISSNNGSKSTPTLLADVFGDWREEIILRAADNQKLYIMSTDYATEHRLFTFMHDAQYRSAIAWQNTAYNQPPHPSYFIDPAMDEPKQPSIYVVQP
ncbi:RICIN domain-containing protein [Marinicellulosiphila megalodicopiae]|uniref:rhamnogalacturonan lyase family protein n=1 Tax=Marinicellulosiphila megalodicopiae TaxID=2724896 RepID=UPI003BAEC198